jgi:ABC-2 type transport system permease protein
MIILAYSLSILAMLLAPVVLAVLLRRKFRAPWLLFVVGSLTFIGSQIVHLPLNNLLANIGLLPKAGDMTSVPILQTALLVGLTAGLCEETARAVGYWLLKRYRRGGHGMMLGLGHGGIEAMVFGGVLTAATISSLIALQGMDLEILNFTGEQMSQVMLQLEALDQGPWLALAPLIERLIAIAFHVVLSMMVLQAFIRRNALYYVLAVVYHMAIDAAAVYMLNQEVNPWIILGGFFISLIPGIVWLRRIWPQSTAQETLQVPAVAREFNILLVSTRKELIQLWRTKRFLVVAAVFGLFGLTSPLMAYFMPQIFSSIPGAEMFAELIPTPSMKDAMDQYVKNITQFGFILAVVFGMSAVVGEKEKGTAAMILSKPMPRWAFITSKFIAQCSIFIVGFLISTFCAYLYTLVLFGPFNFLSFLAVNGLMLLWLLTYVAVALFGSVVGASTPAAAGIGLGGAVVLMLSANLPNLGMLTPSGLIAWASQIAVGAEDMLINGGAVVLGIVIIMMCLIASVAMFERQEL